MKLYQMYVRQCRSMRRTPYIHPEHPVAEAIWAKTEVTGEARDTNESLLFQQYVAECAKVSQDRPTGSPIVPFACAHLAHRVALANDPALESPQQPTMPQPKAKPSMAAPEVPLAVAQQAVGSARGVLSQIQAALREARDDQDTVAELGNSDAKQMAERRVVELERRLGEGKRALDRCESLLPLAVAPSTRLDPLTAEGLLLDPRAWASGAASALTAGATPATAHAAMAPEHPDWRFLRRQVGLHASGPSTQPSPTANWVPGAEPEAPETAARLASLRAELGQQREEREAVARQTALYALDGSGTSGQEGASPCAETRMGSVNLMEAEQQRGAMHAALMRERVSRLEAKGAANSPPADCDPSLRGFDAPVPAWRQHVTAGRHPDFRVGETLLEPIVHRDPSVLSDVRSPLRAVPSPDPRSRYHGESAVSYASSMHAEYYVRTTTPELISSATPRSPCL